MKKSTQKNKSSKKKPSEINSFNHFGVLQKRLCWPRKSIIFTIVIIGGIILTYALIDIAYNVAHKSQTAEIASSNQQLGGNSMPIIQAADLVGLFNKQRASEGLAKLSENLKLDSAAVARAKDMIAKGYQDNSSHNPWSFVAGTGYKYQTIKLNSYSGLSSAQGVINNLQASKDSASLFSATGVSDIGVGVARGKVNGQSVQIVVFYLASTKTVSSTVSSSSPGCSTIPIPYTTSYVKKDYLAKGETENIGYGHNGSKIVCPAQKGHQASTMTIKPINATVFVGTGANDSKQQAATTQQQKIEAQQQALRDQNAATAARNAMIQDCIRKIGALGGGDYAPCYEIQ